MAPLTVSQPASPCDLPVVFSPIDRARAYVAASQSANTLRAYAADLRDFSAFCARDRRSAVPATCETVTLYIAELAARAKFATVRRRIAAIARAHKEQGLDNPCALEPVRRVLHGIARTHGTAPTRKAALSIDAIRRTLLGIRGDGLKSKRDRAVLLLGFAAALRRSELAALDVEDLAWSKSGLTVTIRRSKTDQGGAGAAIPVPFVAERGVCAARAVREWLDAAGLTRGCVFPTFTLAGTLSTRRIGGGDVARLVKALAAGAQLDGDFSGHSLRAGFVTSAAQSHVSLDRIAAVTRHRSLSVLAGYVRRANLFEDPVLSSIVAPRAQKVA